MEIHGCFHLLNYPVTKHRKTLAQYVACYQLQTTLVALFHLQYGKQLPVKFAYIQYKNTGA